MLLPSSEQITKYKINFIFTQTGLIFIFFYILKDKFDLYSEQVLWLLISSATVLILIKNIKYFNIKDIYEMSLFEDKVIIEYLPFFFVAGRKVRVIPFSNLEEISLIIINGRNIFSFKRTLVFFKLDYFMEDFKFETMSGADLNENIAKIQKQFDIYKNKSHIKY